MARWKVRGKGRWRTLTALVVLTVTVGCSSKAPSVVPSANPSRGVDLGDVVKHTWGPDRTMFTVAEPANYPTMNSIENNPAVGDERDFYSIRDLDTGPATNNIVLHANKKYEMSIYFENAAAPGLPNGKTVGTRLRAKLPAFVLGRAPSNAFISALNTRPKIIWSTLVVSSPSSDALTFSLIPDTARIHTSGKADGLVISDSDLFGKNGALIGCDTLDGVLAGGSNCSGYVSFDVSVGQPNFEIESYVRSETKTSQNPNSWQLDTQASPGETLEILIVYRNTGTVQQDNVTVRAKIDPLLQYIKGSTKFANTLIPSGSAASDGLPGQGINIGSYATGSTAYVWFTARVHPESDLQCGDNALSASSAIETDNGTKKSATTIGVNRSCK